MTKLGCAQNFSVVPTGLPALTDARSEWVDFNNDNRSDLFIAGVNNVGGLHTAVYLNNGDNTFNSISLTPLADIAFDFGDYNKDGYIDIVISGINSSAIKKTILYRNDSGTGFTAQATQLENVSRGGVVWKDIDSDTDLDLILSGLDGSNDEVTLVYLYDGVQYQNITHLLPAVSNGKLRTIDANNDDMPEVIISGINTNGIPITHLYTWHTNNVITDYSTTIPGTAFNSLTISDYNNDGYADIFIAGLSGENLEKKTFVLRNNGAGNFVSIASGFVDVSSASMDATDMNNDGLTDIVLSGIDNGGLKYFKYYQNSPGFTFNNAAHSMPNIYNGDAAIADYDNDGDLDIFQIGNSDITFQANLFSSDQASTTTNDPPSVPADLEAVVIGDSLYFSWSASSDDHTNAASISYNLYISREDGGEDLLVSPLSDITSGFRRTTEAGNAGYKTFKSFHGIPEGKFYWSVQAIDNGNKASAFASEKTFSVCYPVSLGADTTICESDVLELSLGDGSDEVNWYSKTNGLLLADNNDFSPTILENDTIVAELTRPFGCTVKDTLIVTMSSPPVIDLGNDLTICFGEPFQVEVHSSIDSVNWYNPEGELARDSHEYSYAVEVKDTIIVHAYNIYKCLAIDSVIVDVYALPVLSAGSDREICYGENTQLEVTGTWSTVNWYSEDLGELALNSPSYELEVRRDHTVVAEVHDQNGCVNYDSAEVEMLPLPVISLGDDISVCYMEVAHLELTGTGVSTKWFDSEQNLLTSDVSEYSYHVLDERSTIVEVIDENQCVSYDTVIVHVLPLPVFSVGSDTAVCYDEEILLEAGAGFDRVDWYSKSSGEIINPDSWFFNYHVSETDTLIAKVLHPNSCINYDSIRIEMLPLPDIGLGEDRNVCYRDEISLHIDGNWEEVNWYTDNNLILQPDDPSYAFKVEQSLPVWVEVFDSHRCVSYDTLQVNVLSLPLFDLNDELNYCDGDTISLHVESIADVRYLWSDAEGTELSTSSEYVYRAESSHLIRLTVSDGFDCTFVDSASVVVHSLPEFLVTGDLVICENDTVSLSVDFPNATIEWVDQGTQMPIEEGSMLQKPFSKTSVLEIRLTDVNTCSSKETITLTVHERPKAQAGPDQLLCYDEQSFLGEESSVGLLYQWSPVDFLDDPTKSKPLITGTSTRAYSLTVTNEHQCSSVDSIYVEVNPEIIVDAGNNIGICIGDSITLGGNPTASGSMFPYSYQWVAGEESLEGNSANPTVVPSTTTLYYVFVTSGKCSVEMDSIEVVVHSLPVVSIISDQSIGAGSSVQLSAEGGVEYDWSPAESLNDPNISSPLATPLKTTKYLVRITDINNCQDTASVHVFVQNKLFVPNTFSPNGDNANDLFKLYGSGVAEIVFSIFDQKGNRVYHTTDREALFEHGWDGKFNGNTLKDDIYFWTIGGTFYNGDPIQYEGKNNGIIKLMK